MIAAKHQIFISSTYADLIQERQELFIQTYRLHHIPIGMEGFTASNMGQWEYIRRRVTECDYFVLVIANRYGSLMPDGSGVSFTEAEYDLALSLGKPVLRFVLRDSALWPGDENHRENEGASRKRLQQFKKRLLATNLVGAWSTKDELASVYLTALSDLVHTDPRGGLYPRGSYPELMALGIRSVTPYSNSTDHTPVLSSPGPITIVLNDGYHFVQKYGAQIRGRLVNGWLTRILLAHPDSPNVAVIARKSNKSVPQQQTDIRKTVSQLKSLCQNDIERGLLSCLGHEYINAYAGSISSSCAIISLYFTRIRSNELTTLTLDPSHDGLYGKYAEDIDQLWRETESTAGSNLLDLADAKGVTQNP